MVVVLDDWLGEDHVGLSIMYCLGTMLVVMAIWKWPLFWIIFYHYFLREHLLSHNEGHVPNLMKWEQLVWKKKKTFHKKKWTTCDFEGVMFRIEGFVWRICVKCECVDVLWDELLLAFPSWKDILEARVLELVVWRLKSLWIRYSKKVAYKRRHKVMKIRHRAKCRYLQNYLVQDRWCVYVNIHVVQIW
jgi:hypothetical protein